MLLPTSWLALTSLLACSSGDSPAVDDEDKDTTPPSTVTDLMVLNVTTQSGLLQWTAPEDRRDDGRGGPVVSYDVRMSDAMITEQTFAQAQVVDGAPTPLPAGNIQTLPVAGLTPGSSFYFALKACDDHGNWSALSDCPRADCLPLEVVTFADPALEQAMRAHVHRPTGDLHSTDVDTILHFAAPIAGIVSLAGMQACASLQTAELAGNSISDLAPLTYLYGLRGLYLNGNQISDVGPLVGLAALRQLHLMNNPVTNLLPVGYLFSLEQLTLSGTDIADYSPLFGLAYLADLYLGGMNLVNIDFVARLPHLRILNLEINHIESAEALRGLTALEALSLWQNEIVDLAPLAGLVNLRDVNLARNRITDLAALVENAGLGAGDALDLRENPLSATALSVQVPALQARGVGVQHCDVPWGPGERRCRSPGPPASPDSRPPSEPGPCAQRGGQSPPGQRKCRRNWGCRGQVPAGMLNPSARSTAPPRELASLRSRSMKNPSIAAAALLLVSGIASAAGPAAVLDTRHVDHRGTPKLLAQPQWSAPSAASGEGLARAFLAAEGSAFGIPREGGELRLSRVQQSLLGTHYVFQQTLDGIDVQGAEVIVSVAKSGGRVYRAFNNYYPVGKGQAAAKSARLGEAAAFDAAWNRLRAHGDLLSRPAARMLWTPEGEHFRLNWIVDLELSAPYGAWRVRVDASTGEVVAVEDARLYRVADGFTRRPVEERIAEWSGPIADRAAAFAAFQQQEATRLAPAGAAGISAAGTGLVFDPDPRATLMNDNLQDGSSAASFTGAYLPRNLLDITFSSGVYRLTGPWCDIINWDPPATVPSTTVDGNWTATRGNNAFNDAMTYFHIDQSQRYMQALGFTGPTGIQQGPIGTDTDGLSGADNSYYLPGTNRLAYGHGCVDDNEDADVILHEYGHAINYGINPSWGGGDMGAIGEGWGDYWAGSYSYSTPNGATYHPEWVFSWDGHGTGDLCWAGRILNALGAQYVHATTYDAHEPIAGGYQSDELWSTPCFQSLVALVGLGRPRGEVDTIMLEAQFGLGGGLKMRDMANAIIQTAQLLYPAGPHADVLIEKFLVHDIIVVPAASLEPTDITANPSGGNGVPDPGETVSFQLEVHNAGTLGATAVAGTLTSPHPGVTVLQGSSAYPDLPAGGSGQNVTDFTIHLAPSIPCGDPIPLSLQLDFDDGDPSSTSLSYAMATGVPVGASGSVSPELSIPDNNTTGVTSSLVISGTGAVVSSNFNVDVNISHTYIGDLIVTLRSPAATTVTLHNRSGGSASDIIGNYPNTLTPAQPLSAFLGQPLDGTWQLNVSDRAGLDVGVLHSWGINDISGWACDELTAATPLPGSTAAFALYPSWPNPFASSSMIRFAVPGQGAEVNLAVFDVAGRRIRTLASGFTPAGEHVVTWDGRDDAGRSVGSGTYFYRLQSAAYRHTQKIVLVQ